MNREVHVRFWEGAECDSPALLAYLHAYENVSAEQANIALYLSFSIRVVHTARLTDARPMPCT